ncbi:hypothetical protein BGZ98_000290 [Dissophora globulifera]|nr:hypothetical protein BGZ98_000290 [Dissophora globulifera]
MDAFRNNFPENTEFLIGLRNTNRVLDVAGDNFDAGTHVILWDRKFEDDSNQRWMYKNGQICNVKSGLVLSAPHLGYNVAVDQQPYTYKDTQTYDYDGTTVFTQANSDYVLGTLHSTNNGAPVALVSRDEKSISQQWNVIL